MYKSGLALAKVVLAQQFLLVAGGIEPNRPRLLTVQGIILRMRCMAPIRSGTVLWSHLLLASREIRITRMGFRQGGDVVYVLGVHR